MIDITIDLSAFIRKNLTSQDGFEMVTDAPIEISIASKSCNFSLKSSTLVSTYET